MGWIHQEASGRLLRLLQFFDRLNDSTMQLDCFDPKANSGYKSFAEGPQAFFQQESVFIS